MPYSAHVKWLTFKSSSFKTKFHKSGYSSSSSAKTASFGSRLSIFVIDLIFAVKPTAILGLI